MWPCLHKTLSEQVAGWIWPTGLREDLRPPPKLPLTLLLYDHRFTRRLEGPSLACKPAHLCRACVLFQLLRESLLAPGRAFMLLPSLQAHWQVIKSPAIHFRQQWLAGGTVWLR